MCNLTDAVHKTKHPFNLWNVVLCLQNCFAECDKIVTANTQAERDLGLKLYRKDRYI